LLDIVVRNHPAEASFREGVIVVQTQRDVSERPNLEVDLGDVDVVAVQDLLRQLVWGMRALEGLGVR
ncbi:hypothetical protein, partial [Pseudomonas aeruginosa]|uniref:hypothetical protein n=1 Tax=Pseudomonas aeruginosa TaxID=287 RepID=UPI003CC60FF5